MAYFASVNTTSGPLWINLDYVLRVEEGADEAAITTVRMTNGEVLKLSHAEGANLVRELRRCNGHREE